MRVESFQEPFLSEDELLRKLLALPFWLTFGDKNSSADHLESFHPLPKRFPDASS